jgi:hypothetical protein
MGLDTQEPSSINENKPLCVTVRLRRFGLGRGIPSSLIEVAAEKRLIKARKQILESQEYQAIVTLDGEIRNFLRRYCLPSQLRPGFHFFSPKSLEDLDKGLLERKGKRQELVDQFIAAYALRKEEAREKLGPLYREMDYPPAEDLPAHFSMETRYISFDVDEKLSSFSQAIYQRECKKRAAEFEVLLEDVRQGMRAGFAGLVDSLVGQLGEKADGTKRKLYTSAVEKMEEFLKLFAAKNIAGDEELDTLVEKARLLIQGVHPQKLRKDQSIRDYVKGGMTKIQEALKPLVQESKGRRYRLEDETEE